jgi:hypothetical protein
MNKKLLTLLIAFLLFIGYPMADISAATTTGSTPASKTVTKTVKKKTATKKKVVKRKRKERLISAPKPFTLETAPHSPQPIAKAKKKTTKKTVKKA